MTIGQAKFFMVCAAVLFMGGLLVVSSGEGAGWFMAVIGLSNVAIGYANYKKAQRNS